MKAIKYIFKGTTNFLWYLKHRKTVDMKLFWKWLYYKWGYDLNIVLFICLNPHAFIGAAMWSIGELFCNHCISPKRLQLFGRRCESKMHEITKETRRQENENRRDN